MKSKYYVCDDGIRKDILDGGINIGTKLILPKETFIEAFNEYILKPEVKLTDNLKSNLPKVEDVPLAFDIDYTKHESTTGGTSQSKTIIYDAGIRYMNYFPQPIFIQEEQPKIYEE